MTSISQFNIIKKKCDRILGKNPNIYFISNNILNVIKGHPYHLKDFKKPLLSIFFSFILNLLKFFLEMITSLKKIFEKKVTDKEKFDCLLICNLINSKSLNNVDYIYGDLEKNLKQNYKVFKLLINHTRDDNEKLKNLLKDRRASSIIGFESKNFIFDLKSFLILFCYFTFFLYKTLIYFDRKYLVIAFGFLDFSTKKNLNLMKNFSDFINNSKFNNLTLPYEGYSWERLILMKSYKLVNKRFGYNFSALVKNQHSLIRKLNLAYEPDVIFTPGNYSKNKLKDLSVPIKCLGSNRFYKNNKLKKTKFKKIRCLILPEGIISECKKLFSFSIRAAHAFPNIQFVWRLHPSMDFNEILRKLSLSNKNSLPKNIIISKLNFFDDISKSHMAIYRGSTSIITALQNEIYPIYLNDNEDINIDPIYEMKKWKLVINDLNELKKINNIKFIKKIQSSKDKKYAKKFAKNYFDKINPNVLFSQINKSLHQNI